MAQSLALQGMAEAERGRGNVTLAQLRAEESLKIVESLRSAVARPDLQTSYLAVNRNAYSLLIRCLMERHRQQPGGGFDLQALSRSEQARARVLLDALRESRELRADLRSHVPSELLAQRRDLLVAIAAEEAQHRRPGASPAEAAAAEQALAASLDRLSEVDTAIRRSRHGDRPFGLPPASVAEQRRQLLDENTLLLEYHLGTPHSHLWAVSINGVQSFELPGREILEPLLRSAYEQLAGLSAPDPAGEARTLQLSRLLLGPVAAQMRGKRLLIAADGTQQYIPFAALPAPGGRHEPILLEHEIVSIPSLAVLAELRGRSVDRQPPPRTLALLADPVFDASDERLTRMKPQMKPARQDIGEDRFLPRLLSSRDEAEAIARLLPAGEVLEALDFDASRDLVTNGDLSRYRILHFATHGLQRTDHPELSALVLSRFDRQGTPREGYLRVSDLAGLDLPADLVVLSACETALGQQAPGEGLVGLPQAFLAAGAQRILVSLWEVGDESTAALMEQFYRRLLIDHQPAGRALREAQLAIRAQPRWRSPRYWAGFVLQGDWQ
jgi:CHAT domain-containing protein